MKKIIHIDMDAFYASIEQRDFPGYRGKPLVVGGGPERGVVAAASYEARKFGIHSAMPSKIALSKCSQLIFVKPRFDIYREVSNKIMAIFYDYTDLVEPLSLDEAFLDVTLNKKGSKIATDIAKEIKSRIRDEVRLSASAGVSFNKFLAKIASDYKKPDGLFVIKPKAALIFIDKLPISKFFGVGKVTEKKMHSLGINNGKDLRKMGEKELQFHFGKAGSFFYQIARTVDERPVNPDRTRKSIGAERTFKKDLRNISEMQADLKKIAGILINRMEKSNSYGYTLTLKIKFSNFRQITRSLTIYKKINQLEQIKQLALRLLQTVNFENQSVRLFGLSISNLTIKKKENLHQLNLFDNLELP